MTTGNEMSVRDEQMARNLIWLAEKAYPGKKIIVWPIMGISPRDDDPFLWQTTSQAWG